MLTHSSHWPGLSMSGRPLAFFHLGAICINSSVAPPFHLDRPSPTTSTLIFHRRRASIDKRIEFSLHPRRARASLIPPAGVCAYRIHRGSPLKKTRQPIALFLHPPYLHNTHTALFRHGRSQQHQALPGQLAKKRYAPFFAVAGRITQDAPHALGGDRTGPSLQLLVPSVIRDSAHSSCYALLIRRPVPVSPFSFTAVDLELELARFRNPPPLSLDNADPEPCCSYQGRR